MPSLLKDTTIALITRGITLVIAAASTVIISRELQPALKGSYSIIMLVMTVTLMLSAFGIGSTNVYLGARSPEKLPVMAGNSLVAGIAFGLLGTIIVEILTLTPGFQHYLTENGVPVDWVRWFMLLLPVLQVEAYLREIVRAAGRLALYNIMAVVEYAGNFIGLIILVIGLKYSISGAIWAWVIAEVITAALSFWFAARSAGARMRLDWRTFRENLTFGLKLHPGVVAQFLNYRLDLLLVGLFLTPTDVGLYATATVLAEMLWELPNSIRTVLMYQVSADGANSGAMTTARVSRIVAALIGVLCIIIALISYPLIRLVFGESYAASAPVLVLLLPGIWTLGLGKLLGVYLVAQGKPEVATLSTFVSLVATVIFDVLLIPTIGISGAAIASSISYFLATVVIVYTFLRLSKLSLVQTIFVHRADLLYLRRILFQLMERYGLRRKSLNPQ